MSLQPFAVAPVMGQLAATPAAGFALQNATPTILTWTAPADGRPHRVLLLGNVWVTSAETGGALGITATDPGGNSITGIPAQFDAGAHGLGFHALGNGSGQWAILVAPGSTVTVAQISALTVGAAVLWCELWGS